MIPCICRVRREIFKLYFLFETASENVSGGAQLMAKLEVHKIISYPCPFKRLIFWNCATAGLLIRHLANFCSSFWRHQKSHMGGICVPLLPGRNTSRSKEVNTPKNNDYQTVFHPVIISGRWLQASLPGLQLRAKLKTVLETNFSRNQARGGWSRPRNSRSFLA
jgi:hypothetical protein